MKWSGEVSPTTEECELLQHAVDIIEHNDELNLDGARFYPDGSVVFVVRRQTDVDWMAFTPFTTGTLVSNKMPLGDHIEISTAMHGFPNEDFINRVGILL